MWRTTALPRGGGNDDRCDGLGDGVGRRAPSRPPRSSGADPAGPKPRRRPMPSLPLRLMAARRTGFGASPASAMLWNEGTLRRIPTYESSWTRRASSSASMTVRESNVADAYHPRLNHDLHAIDATQHLTHSLICA